MFTFFLLSFSLFVYSCIFSLFFFLSEQGAPGNRGFPGAEGGPGPKASFSN